jgi:hypothetical protein
MKLKEKIKGGETQKPKMIIDINKHGIRRERFADSRIYKKYLKRAK